MNVIPEAIGSYMRATQSLRRDLEKLQKQNEIMREALKSILESEDTFDEEDIGTNAVVKYNTLYLKSEARKALKQIEEMK